MQNGYDVSTYPSQGGLLNCVVIVNLFFDVDILDIYIFIYSLAVIFMSIVDLFVKTRILIIIYHTVL